MFTLSHALFLLILFYQLNDFARHYSRESELHSSYVQMARDVKCASRELSGELSVRIESVSYRGVSASCEEAQRQARSFPLLSAFSHWVESKYLFKLMTMESRITQGMSILLLMWLIYVMGKYYTTCYQMDRISLPYNTVPPPYGAAFRSRLGYLLWGDPPHAGAGLSSHLLMAQCGGRRRRRLKARVQELTSDEEGGQEK